MAFPSSILCPPFLPNELPWLMPIRISERELSGAVQTDCLSFYLRLQIFPQNLKTKSHPTTANHALQRTAPCVTAPDSTAALPPAVQVPRRTPRSLSLGSLGVATRPV